MITSDIFTYLQGDIGLDGIDHGIPVCLFIYHIQLFSMSGGIWLGQYLLKQYIIYFLHRVRGRAWGGRGFVLAFVGDVLESGQGG